MGDPEGLHERFAGRICVNPETGCWLWTGARLPNGYGKVTVRAGGRGVVGAHRLAYELMVGPIPEGAWVLHRCDVPLCIRPAHLFTGTAADNAADRDAKGRGARLVGESNARSKLTAEEVTTIKLMAAGGARIVDLARWFKVRDTAIGKILRGQRWAHVPGPSREVR